MPDLPLNFRVNLVEQVTSELKTTQADHAEKLVDVDRRVFGLEQTRLAWHERAALYAAAAGVMFEVFCK